MAHDADRNLLFGLLALQNDLIDQIQLVTAFQAWTRDKVRPLAEQLVARGDIDAEQHALVQGLVKQHLKKHDGDCQRSLAAIKAARSTRECLASVKDADVEASLVRLGVVATHMGDDADCTATYGTGTASSDGQRYRILRPHARGGLGAVFVALDEELHREVALKQILEQHADDPVSRQRFLLEAEVTGSLEHPGVVPVYGLGNYADGRPFYAMRFIRGDSLKEAIEHFHADPGLKKDSGRRSLELRRLLRRYLDVCYSIEYAHSRGVLHRDIKPGNIIIGKHGETLVVDWGLAKALGRVEPGSDSGERTLVPPSASGWASTLPGSALGTPAYMSPEQSEGDLQRVGARSDVYSLGATLYCLLTGKPPFEGDLADVIVGVQKGQFPPPRQLDPALDRLEAICMKAMALKPADRFGSPRGLAEDAERWMADEPVSAWREPWTRMLIRWLTRHRVGVTAAAASVLVALLGTGAVLGVQTTANAELKRANSHLAMANDRVTRANADLQAAGERERQRFDLAMEAIKLFHGEVSEDLLLKEKQFEALRAKLLKGAAGFYGKLERFLEGQPDVSSRAGLGRAYFELGDLTGAIGRAPQALALHRKALAVRRDMAATPGADSAVVLDVVRSLLAVGTWLGSTGDDAAEMASYDEALGLAEGLINAGRGGDEARFEMAVCLDTMSYDVAQQRPVDGLEMVRRAQAISRDLVARNPSDSRSLERLASAQFAMGGRLSMVGKHAESISAYQESVAIYQKLASAEPERYHFQDVLGRLHNNIASALWSIGKLDEAITAERAAVEIWRKAVDRTPAATSLVNNLAFGLDVLATDLGATGRALEALEALAEARPILQKLADANVGDTASQRNLAKNYLFTGHALGRMGMRLAAKEALENGLSIAQQQADEHPSMTGIQSSVADYVRDAGWDLWKLNWTAEALEAFGRERAIRHRLGASRRGDDSDHDWLANCETNSAAALARLGRLLEAGECCDRAIAIREELVKKQPANHRFQQNLAESLLRSGSERAAAGDAAGAAAHWRLAAAKFASHPPGGESAIFRACCHGALAGLAGAGIAGVSAAGGVAQAEEAMAILRQEVAGGYRDVDLLRVEPGLDALRTRDDFRQMMMDLVFPVDPFAWRVNNGFRPVPTAP